MTSLALFAVFVTKVTTSLNRYRCILSCTTHTKIMGWFGKTLKKPISKVLVVLTSAIVCVMHIAQDLTAMLKMR